MNPLVNGALIQPYNVVSGVIQDLSNNHLTIGNIDKLAVTEASTYSPNWFVESAAGGIGSFVPFLAAGKVTGCAMRGTGRLLGLESEEAASLLANEGIAQLTGAGIYSAMKRPEVGESRVGNAASTVAGFAIFEGGNTIAENLGSSKGLLGVAGKLA